MARTFRRLVTGHGAEGRSVLAEDREIGETGNAGNFDFWASGPSDNEPPFPFFPRAGRTAFRAFRIPPDDPTVTAAELGRLAETFFAEVGDPWCRHDTSRHPLMHRTPTVDYVMLLSGEAALLLDEGEPIPLKPFDTIVQRGTNHMWLNTGREDAVFLVVMVGAPEE